MLGQKVTLDEVINYNLHFLCIPHMYVPTYCTLSNWVSIIYFGVSYIAHVEWACLTKFVIIKMYSYSCSVFFSCSYILIQLRIIFFFSTKPSCFLIYSRNSDVWWIHCSLQVHSGSTFFCHGRRQREWAYFSYSSSGIFWCRRPSSQVVLAYNIICLFFYSCSIRIFLGTPVLYLCSVANLILVFSEIM